MRLHRPVSRHLDIGSAAMSVPVDAGGFMWFTPACSVPAVAVALPHDAALQISWAGYGYNLGLATLGNILGGGVFVGGMYWLGSPGVRAANAHGRLVTAPAVEDATAGTLYQPEPA